MYKVVIIRKDSSEVFHGKPLGTNAESFTGSSEDEVYEKVCDFINHSKKFIWSLIIDLKLMSLTKQFPRLRIYMKDSHGLKVNTNVSIKYSVGNQTVINDIKTHCRTLGYRQTIRSCITHLLRYIIEECTPKKDFDLVSACKTKMIAVYSKLSDSDSLKFINYVSSHNATYSGIVNGLLTKINDDPIARSKLYSYLTQQLGD